LQDRIRWGLKDTNPAWRWLKPEVSPGIPGRGTANEAHTSQREALQRGKGKKAPHSHPRLRCGTRTDTGGVL